MMRIRLRIKQTISGIKHIKLLFAALTLLLVCCKITPAGIDFVPAADISLSGGQYFWEGDPSSFGGNADIYFSPALIFNQDNILIPLISILYSGTQDVQELAGGGTLTRQTAAGGLNLTYITTISGLKTRFRTGYRMTYINETEDEDWTEGLFDYSRLLFGAEVEERIFNHDLSFSADYYNVEFPNYNSLISEKSEFEGDTFKEISEEAGENVLDYSDIIIGIAARRQHNEDLNINYSYSLSLRNYEDQPVVKSDGSFSSDSRRDVINTLNAGLSYRYKKAVLGLENQSTLLSSNQNSYDAGATKHIDNFYSYLHSSFIPSVTLYMETGEVISTLKLWWNIGLRRYSGRLARDENGSYTNNNVTQTDNSFGFSYRYPIFKDISATVRLNGQLASSNMEYEGSYKYNYSAFNYHMGLNWMY